MDHMELVRKAYAGDKLSREKLMEQNQGLIWSVVKRFKNRGYEEEDLFQIGCIGLMKAIDRFDLKYEVAFSTYAVPMITGEIKRFLRDDGMVKVSRKIKENEAKIRINRQKYIQRFGHEPDMRWLSEECHLSTEDLVNAMGYENHLTYFEEPDSEGRPMLERLSSGEDFTGMVEERLTVNQAMNQLDQMEQKIIRMRYYENKTQTEVGKILSLSQVRISRMEKRIMEKMRCALIQG
ncbi:MAG: sigma-70 family RNA polymerase sigma factor [Eubacterium sp.]|nr:sigma-70 family RNA polymerase sigma factor [Eubacterium sp.]